LITGYIVRTKERSIREVKEYHRNKRYELSLKSIGEIPRLDECTDEQKEWVLFRLSHSNTWPNVYDNKIGDSKNRK